MTYPPVQVNALTITHADGSSIALEADSEVVAITQRRAPHRAPNVHWAMYLSVGDMDALVTTWLLWHGLEARPVGH